MSADIRFVYSGSVDTGMTVFPSAPSPSRLIRYTLTRLLGPLLCNSDARLPTSCWYWLESVRFAELRCFCALVTCDEKSLRDSSITWVCIDPLMAYMEKKHSRAAVRETTSIDNATVRAFSDRCTRCLPQRHIFHICHGFMVGAYLAGATNL